MTTYSADGDDMAGKTETSMSLGMVLAIGVLLGTLAIRHADGALIHSAHTTAAAVAGI